MPRPDNPRPNRNADSSFATATQDAAPLLTLEERHSVLERVWELNKVHDYQAVRVLLTSVSEQDLVAEPELGVRLCESWNYFGEWKQSLVLLGKLIEPCRRRGNDQLFRGRLFAEISARLAQGELAEAEEMAANLLQFADQAGDAALSAAASETLGIVADINCAWNEAVLNYQRALVMRQRAGSLRGRGAAHHNLAMTYRHLGRYADASAHFGHAMIYFQAAGTGVDVAQTEMERALLLSVAGDSKLAVATANRALRRFSESGHKAGIGDTNRVLGIIAVREGQFAIARQHLEVAHATVLDTGDRLTRAEILEELAVLEMLERNSEQSGGRAEEAGRIYRDMGADRRAERMEERLREVAAGTGAV